MQFDELVADCASVFDADVVATLATFQPRYNRQLTACDVAEFVYLAALTPSAAQLHELNNDLRNGAHAVPTEHGDPLGEDMIQALTYLFEDASRPLRLVNSIDFDSSMRLATFDLRMDRKVIYANELLPDTRMASRPLRVYAPWFYTLANRIAR